MDNPSTVHERFGELSALAIIGQVSPEEYGELREHLESCALCRKEHEALSRNWLTRRKILTSIPGPRSDRRRRARGIPRAAKFSWATTR